MFGVQELNNVLWAYAKLRFFPGDFVELLDELVQDEQRTQRFRGCDWASLLWGLATLGAPISEDAMSAINSHALEHLRDMTAVELCNILW